MISNDKSYRTADPQLASHLNSKHPFLDNHTS